MRMFDRIDHFSVVQGEEWQDWAMGVCCTPFVSCQTAAEHEERNGAK